MEMSSNSIREKYLGLPNYISSDVPSAIDEAGRANLNTYCFQKPDEDILPNLTVQDKCKLSTIIEQLKQANCEYCIGK